jgi:hypothetical protein
MRGPACRNPIQPLPARPPLACLLGAKEGGSITTTPHLPTHRAKEHPTTCAHVC